MAKFDVYQMLDADGYLIDCQADLLSDLSTRLVVPLLPIERAPMPAARLNPIFSIEGSRHVMVTQFAATLPVQDLRQPVTSLREHDFTVGNALDMLISGY
jgi:toxin CcdB